MLSPLSVRSMRAGEFQADVLIEPGDQVVDLRDLLRDARLHQRFDGRR